MHDTLLNSSMRVSYLLQYRTCILVISLFDQDPEVYPFQDWGSPTGKDYRAVLFLLPGVAGLSGGTLRIPNSFLTQVSGGRNVVFNTSLLLCVPMIMAGFVLSNPTAPFNALRAGRPYLVWVDGKTPTLSLEFHDLFDSGVKPYLCRII